MDHNATIAATSAALRMLLSGKPLAKPENVQIVGSMGFPAAEAAGFVATSLAGNNTLLLIFDTASGEAALRMIMVFDGVTDPKQAYAGTCMPIKKEDGTFALLSQNEERYEITFGANGRTLTRRSVDGRDRPEQEAAGLEALREMTASEAAQSESYSSFFA